MCQRRGSVVPHAPYISLGFTTIIVVTNSLWRLRALVVTVMMVIVEVWRLPASGATVIVVIQCSWPLSGLSPKVVVVKQTVTGTQRNKSLDKYALNVVWLCRIDALKFTIINTVIDSMWRWPTIGDRQYGHSLLMTPTGLCVLMRSSLAV